LGTSTHYVIAIGYSGDTIYVNDPWQKPEEHSGPTTLGVQNGHEYFIAPVPGGFANGWHNDGSSQAIADTFAYKGGADKVGRLVTDGGGYTHEWLSSPNDRTWKWPGYFVQNFANGSFGPCAIIYNKDAKAAYLIRGGFWNVFRYGVGDNTGWGPTIAVGGNELGFPTCDENTTMPRIQYFTNGRMEWDGNNVRLCTNYGKYCYTVGQGVECSLKCDLVEPTSLILSLSNSIPALLYRVWLRGTVRKDITSGPKSLDASFHPGTSGQADSISVTLDELSPNQDYAIQVTAYDGDGDSVAYSNNLTVHTSSSASSFVRAEGSHLVVGETGQVVRLRGVGFGNTCYQLENEADPMAIVRADHDATDFARVRAMGMNAVRFYLSFWMFVDKNGDPYTYRQDAWDWFDGNIQWAKNNGVYLIPNVHVPPGGYQQDANNDKIPDGLSLWSEPEKQAQLKALWEAIAQRYRNETTIAGYDLLNEPTTLPAPSGFPKYQRWKDLAEEIVAQIRQVDSNHLIVIEALAGAFDLDRHTWIGTELPSEKLFVVNDANVMYDVHCYYPWAYTLQQQPWSDFPNSAVYPDEQAIIYPWDIPDDGSWLSNIEGRTIAGGSSGWNLYESERLPGPTGALVGLPAFASYENPSGSVYYDALMVKEYDQSGNYIKDALPLYDVKNDLHWVTFLDPSTQTANLALSTTEGYLDSYSLLIANNAEYAQWANHDLKFRVTPGNLYTISCWMKGEGVATGSFCRPTLGFHKSPHDIPIFRRNKEYLAYVLGGFLQYLSDRNVPINVGEFGLVRQCFEGTGGGIQYINDVLDILDQFNANFTYHVFKEDTFGIYRPSALPSQNTALIQRFQGYLGFSDTVGPTIVLSSDVNSATNGMFAVSAVFSEPVTDFTESAILTTNANISDFHGEGVSYGWNLTPMVQGLVTCGIPSGVAHDFSGNPNSGSNSISTVFDDIPASCEIVSSGPPEHIGDLIRFYVTFSKPVTGFSARDVSVSGGNVQSVSGSGDSYVISVLPSVSRSVICEVLDYTSCDAAGNLSEGALPCAVDVPLPIDGFAALVTVLAVVVLGSWQVCSFREGSRNGRGRRKDARCPV
ncbi:MAG TPA: cellulase family glycosylhydrolase, partial [Candidatus Hydrogenedentes bacterium]|nr:cellulase family glycosylhydrolase [Candidatus Hydrogenedentota bacterium]HPG70185.1 cellulase family glycosylhydrolase [Candidatus Hydrogenedentota bacterium]